MLTALFNEMSALVLCCEVFRIKHAVDAELRLACDLGDGRTGVHEDLGEVGLVGVLVMRGGDGADVGLAQVARDVDLDHAVLLHRGNGLKRDAGTAMEHKRAGADRGDLGQVIKVDLGRVLQAVDVADGDGERVATHAPYVLGHLRGVGLAIRLGDVVILLAADGAELGLDRNPARMAVVHGAAAETDVLLERQGGAVDHDGGEAGLHGATHVVERLAVVEVERHGDGVVVDGAMGNLGCSRSR